MPKTQKYSLLFLLLFFTLPTYSQSIWIVRDALKSKNSIENIISNVEKLRCNKIFIQFRALGEVYFPNVDNMPSVATNHKLILKMIKQAKTKGIEVHAWLNVNYIWGTKKDQVNPHHVLNKDTHAILKTIDNTYSQEGIYLHPVAEENLKQLKNIITTLNKLYALDGIHLDYFRFPKETLLFSNIGRTRFMLEHYYDPYLFIMENKKRENKQNYERVYNAYKTFLTSELDTALVRIKNHLAHTNNKLKLSIAVKPSFINAKNRYNQNWLKWLEKGWCDFVITMNYAPDKNNFNKNLIVPDRVKDRIIQGIATYNIKKHEVASRINKVKNSNFAGYALFSYNYIINHKPLFNFLVR